MQLSTLLWNIAVRLCGCNLGCNRLRNMPEIVSKRAGIWSGCAVWLESAQTPLSLTACCLAQDTIWIIPRDQCMFVSVLPRDQRMIERLSEAMIAALVCNKLSRNPSNFHFRVKNKNRRHGPKIKAFYSRTVSVSHEWQHFSSSKPVAVGVCSRLENALYLCTGLQMAVHWRSAKAWNWCLAWFWVDCNQSLQPSRLQMKCDVAM